MIAPGHGYRWEQLELVCVTSLPGDTNAVNNLTQGSLDAFQSTVRSPEIPVKKLFALGTDGELFNSELAPALKKILEKGTGHLPIYLVRARDGNSPKIVGAHVGLLDARQLQEFWQDVVLAGPAALNQNQPKPAWQP